MVVRVTYNDLSDEMKKQLEGYEWSLLLDINKAIEKAAKYGAKQLQTARVYHDRTGAYTKDWTYKHTGFSSNPLMTEQFKIHNKKHYRLTHLLEKGHVGRNGKRVRAFEHIAPAEDITTMYAISEVEKVIRENANK